jgi:dTMP kinase
MSETGAFITFEGIDGCGKTTQLRLAREYLESRALSCLVTREPGGTPIAESIRGILLSPENDAMSDTCEILLYCAARAQHVSERIVPAIQTGTIVLCDRFQEATLAYQGFGRGYDMDELVRLNRAATGGVMPDLTFVFDVSVETAGRRLRSSGKTPDRLEMTSGGFFERVREGYLELARRNQSRIVVLNAEKTAEEIAVSVREKLDDFCCRRERIQG